MTEPPLDKLTDTQASGNDRAETTQPDILDYDALVNRCMGNLELASRLLEKMQSRMPCEIEDVEKALAEKDAEQVTQIAHRMKGATANVSAGGLNRALEEIEHFGRTGVLAEIPASLERLHREWERFKNYSSTVLPLK
jgi:HPt (histidine-containing phosphotransfer) domain-containing protein